MHFSSFYIIFLYFLFRKCLLLYIFSLFSMFAFTFFSYFVSFRGKRINSPTRIFCFGKEREREREREREKVFYLYFDRIHGRLTRTISFDSTETKTQFQKRFTNPELLRLEKYERKRGNKNDQSQTIIGPLQILSFLHPLSFSFF